MADVQKDFIDFIKDSTHNPSLAKKLINKLCEKDVNAKQLSEFFNELGYVVSPDDCQKVLDSRNNIDEVMSGNLKY